MTRILDAALDVATVLFLVWIIASLACATVILTIHYGLRMVGLDWWPKWLRDKDTGETP